MTSSFEIDIEDIQYASPDGVPLLARLYRPRGEGPFPGVVEVHGGAWTKNDRLTNADIHVPLAKSGVVVMAIDFRMPPDAIYPVPITDINLAVRWLKANAASLSVAPEMVGMLGTSSGGHQAMLAAMRPTDSRYMAQDLPGGASADASVAYIALCWPVVDPYARYHMVIEQGNEGLVEAHRAYWPDMAAMDEGSPQRMLVRGEAVQMPPTLLIQGTLDDNLGPDMAGRFTAAYRAAGGDIQLEEFPGAPHAFISKDPGAEIAQRAIGLIVDFVARQTR
ncbi:MAG: alpha/beta hydrolase [Alphaproteobacteria bacterium]|jgi:acetyl esterase/lipase